MATKQQWIEFVQAMRIRQDELRAEARPFEEGNYSLACLRRTGMST
jgi:hypothetical protein